MDAVEAKGFWGHYDGTVVRPEAVGTTVTSPEGITTTTPPTQVMLDAVLQWDKDERSAKSLLTQKIPNLTLMLVHNQRTVKERWDKIVAEYSQKGAYAQTDMRARFLESKCPEKGDVREFLESLRTKREELITMGVSIDDKDYLSTIISSLPYVLSSFASGQLASARLYASTNMIAPDSLISLISEESDRLKNQRSRRAGAGKGKDMAY